MIVYAPVGNLQLIADQYVVRDTTYMKFVSKRFVVFLILLLCVVPGGVRAASSEAVQIQLLRQLVLQLQIKLELLLEQQYESTHSILNSTDSLLDDVGAEVVARYRIEDMDVTSRFLDHERYMERMREIIPDSYHHYYDEFVVFESHNKNIDAFVETILPYNASWRYGVSTDALDELSDDELTVELMVHEFAHVFSLHEVFTDSTPPDCHEYFSSRGGCVSTETLYGKFLNEFWSDDYLDQMLQIELATDPDSAQRAFYKARKKQFVSDYAATGPAEDFAESFMMFVLYEDKSLGLTAEDKVSFFNRFSHTRSLKAEIVTGL